MFYLTLFLDIIVLIATAVSKEIKRKNRTKGFAQ